VGVPALYTALRMETAWLEAQQGLPFKAQPMTMCSYEVDCADVLDLTDPAEQAAQAVTPADLACAWESMALARKVPPSWTLARRLISEGMAGIIVPSYAPGATAIDRSLVFWRWGDAPPHRVAVHDELRRLPHDDASWR
jgi:RES domain-containing protein